MSRITSNTKFSFIFLSVYFTSIIFILRISFIIYSVFLALISPSSSNFEIISTSFKSSINVICIKLSSLKRYISLSLSSTKTISKTLSPSLISISVTDLTLPINVSDNSPSFCFFSSCPIVFSYPRF